MNDKSHQLWQRAAAFAARAHRHAVRKDRKTPYISHVVRVTLTIRHIFGFDDETVLAAALLHDTIEDTGTDYDDILEEFGSEVADLVALLTKDMRLVEDDRERAYDEQLRKASWKARLIKLADVYDNLTDAIEGKRSLERMIEKTRRAIELAKGDSELADAREIVKDLLKQAQSA